jgi:hypothetical protein
VPRDDNPTCRCGYPRVWVLVQNFTRGYKYGYKILPIGLCVDILFHMLVFKI